MDCNKSRQKGVQPRAKSSIPPFRNQMSNCTKHDEVKCLKKDADGQMKLKRNDNYFYKIVTQMAVTGLKWCDFYVWWEIVDHLQSIFFDDEVWQETKNKADDLYFRYFI